jgi:hypothetical protein
VAILPPWNTTASTLTNQPPWSKSNRHDNAVDRRAVVQPRRAPTLSYPIVGVRVPTYLRPAKDRYLAPDLRWLVVVLMASWRS